MKVFNRSHDWEHKVNFVDENNVFVGYDMTDKCCESFGWFIADQIHNKIVGDEDESGLEDYRFDPFFFQEVEDKGGAGDWGYFAVFKLVAHNKPDKYLHLYNYQNGCYSHGFEVKIGDDLIRSGGL